MATAGHKKMNEPERQSVRYPIQNSDMRYIFDIRDMRGFTRRKASQRSGRAVSVILL